MRNLAERSAKAAQSTAELIGGWARRVQEGVQITGETDQAVGEIVTNVVKVKDLWVSTADELNGLAEQLRDTARSTSAPSTRLYREAIAMTVAV